MSIRPLLFLSINQFDAAGYVIVRGSVLLVYCRFGIGNLEIWDGIVFRLSSIETVSFPHSFLMKLCLQVYCDIYSIWGFAPGFAPYLRGFGL